MFKVIGAAVVYGFALFGLAKYFEETSNESEPATSNTGAAKP